MKKISELRIWSRIIVKNGKNNEQDEIGYEELKTQVAREIVDGTTVKFNEETKEIYVDPSLSVVHANTTERDAEDSHPASAISSEDKSKLTGTVEEQLQAINDEAVFYDADGNIEANNIIEGIDITTSSSTPITLTKASPYTQYITGSTAQTYIMPLASTLKLNTAWMFINSSSQLATIKSSGGNDIVQIPSGMASIITCVSLSETTASSWVNIGLNNDMTSDGHLIYSSIVANYSALPPAADNPNKLFYVSQSQGTKWLPGNLGGTYYPNGWYYSDGITYTWQEIPFQATQIEVDAGTNVDKFLTPKTFNDSAQLASRVNIIEEVQLNGVIVPPINKSVNILAATQTELDLKAMQNPGVCQKLPIKPIDIVIDPVALTLTIATINNGKTISALNPIRVFTDGSSIISKWEKTTPQTVSFTKTNGFWYFHFDNTGTLIATQTPWTEFNIIAPIYRFYLNDQLANADMITVRAWEAHLNDQSASDHEWKHAQGTIHESGFDIVCIPLATGTPNASGINTCISLTTGKNSDDGLEYTVTNTQTPTLGFQQDLGITTSASLTISNGALFKVRTNDAQGRLSFLNATRFPFAWDNATNRPQYITTNGTRTLVTDNRWFVYYIYALQDDKVGEAIKIVSAETEFTSLALAQSHKWENLQSLYATLNDKEIRPLYKCVFYADNSGGGAFNVAIKYTVLREVTDIRRQQVTISASAGGSVLASNVVTTPGVNLVGSNAETKFTEIDNYIADHKPWTQSGHTGNANKLMSTDASGNASETDNNTFALRYANTPWFNTGTVSSVGTLVTFSGLGGILPYGINYDGQKPKLTVNGVSRIITNRNNDTQVTIDSAFPSDLVSQAYNVYALEYSTNYIYSSEGTVMLKCYGNGVIYNKPKFSIGVILFGSNVYEAPLTILSDRLLANKSIGAVETDNAKIYHTDLNLIRRALATEDNFVSYQPNPFYSTGTVSVSGTTLTIVGGTFQSLLANNSKIRFSNGEERQITAYTDSTHVTIDRTTGGTVSGATFAIYLTRLKDNGTNLIKTDNAGNQTTL